jgi:predicted Zn-dependent peptidase
VISFHKEILENGLTVLVCEDHTTPMTAVNTLYKVGARDEQSDKTGFAHLFEHLMFSGSLHVSDFDTPLQRAGGQNNAFTNNDFTNYYVTIPKENLETALWLESDRMLGLGFSEEALEVQRKVVIEEFSQRYLNRPYGDLWLHLRPMIYREHPYRWATIGKDPSHIERASMDDVKAFYARYYNPENAILVLSGNIELPKTIDLVKKWYDEIPQGDELHRTYPVEPPMIKKEVSTLERDVPQDAIHMAWLMPDRLHPEYAAYDLLSDVLSNGNSSRLYRSLVKDKSLFTKISAYITGSRDQGLFYITGMPTPGLNLDEAESVIRDEVKKLVSDGFKDSELEKVKNQFIAQKAYSESGILPKAMNLAYFEFLGEADMVNHQQEEYAKVEEDDLLNVANTLLECEGYAVLRYKGNHG